MTKNIPIVVDLDGTLIRSDLLLETANESILANPLSIFPILKQLGKSRVSLKSFLSCRSVLDVSKLPYNQNLLEWLAEQKKVGRSIVLATASHEILAHKVAKHLGIFDDVFATRNDVNLKASNKRDLLVSKFGVKGYDYIGNDQPDMVVWASARKAYVVSSSDAFVSKVKALGNFEHAFSTETASVVSTLIRSLRPHQWIKNLLVFVPLVTAYRLMDSSSVIDAILAFLTFCMTASSVYILNDLADVNDDRHHHRKRFRPFASGNLSLAIGWFIWPLLLASAFLFSVMFLSTAYSWVLCGYFIMTLAYSFSLKQRAMLDVLVLACLYTLRIIAGAVAISVPLSFWLLAFSMFMFLSLAFIKRFSELRLARNNCHEGNLRGRGYVHHDLELVSSMGSSAGYLAVLVLALYIQDPHTVELYKFPQAIWIGCPILLYWISRAWLIAHRGLMHDDPIVFAIKDRVSWIVGVCIIGIFALAKVL